MPNEDIHRYLDNLVFARQPIGTLQPSAFMALPDADDGVTLRSPAFWWEGRIRGMVRIKNAR